MESLDVLVGVHCSRCPSSLSFQSSGFLAAFKKALAAFFLVVMHNVCNVLVLGICGFNGGVMPVVRTEATMRLLRNSFGGRHKGIDSHKCLEKSGKVDSELLQIKLSC